MLTSKQVRVRYARDRILPQYIAVADPEWKEAAERLLELFRNRDGITRGTLNEELRETFGSDPAQIVHQGLAKLLEDRCDFEVVSTEPPERLREAVFLAAARRRAPSWGLPQPPQGGTPTVAEEALGGNVGGPPSGGPTGGEARASLPQPPQGGTPTIAEEAFGGNVGVPPSGGPTGGEARAAVIADQSASLDRGAVLAEVAKDLNLSAAGIEQGLFADLKSEQRLIRFKDISAEHLLQRYNVALAQAILLRSVRVSAVIRHEPPQRYRQLLRLVKFHRLVCEIKRLGSDSHELQLDGPLSLFSATQKYGLQLALFLPALLLCRDFEVRAELRWGPQRKPKTFVITPADSLVSHARDTGMYLPPEFAMFVALFRKKIPDWDIVEEPNIYPLGDSYWVPDFRLTEQGTGKSILLEILGFWRRSGVERHLQRLRQHAQQPFILAVSDQLHVEDVELEGLPVAIHRFRQLPLPEEIVALAQKAAETA